MAEICSQLYIHVLPKLDKGMLCIQLKKRLVLLFYLLQATLVNIHLQGGGSPAQKYLSQLMAALESYYHPSNFGKHTVSKYDFPSSYLFNML